MLSTTKIREALDLMKEIQGYSTADIHAEAMAGVEAIERAAKVIDRWGVGDVMGLKTEAEWDEARDAKDAAEALMESIAKEAP